ncbi:MAG: hypothetical protein GYB33_14765 [Gammaproteobacteria bacterium]|nr:hypothetical protein [Gammaproteobacteria bacterium]
MKKIMMPALALTSGVVLTAAVQTASGQDEWTPGNGNAYGQITNQLNLPKQKGCSTFLSVWWPEHKNACKPVIDWTEVEAGLTIGKTHQAVDKDKQLFYSDITINNNTGTEIPAGSRLIIAGANLALTNGSGLTASGQPYIETTQAIANGESLTVRAEFEHKLLPLSFSTGFETAKISNGVIAISGETRVVRTLTAEVSDPDGISSAIDYQWQADGADITGATAATYKLTADEEGKIITVKASYSDDLAFAEGITSGATTAVAARNANIAGKLDIQGERLMGNTLQAVLDDSNGLAQAASYQWFADGIAIEDATHSSLPLDAALVGRIISVTASYSDYDDYAEAATASTSHIATIAVSGESELSSALASAADGDWVALASGNYAAMASIRIGNAVTLTLAQDSDAIISGSTCIELRGNKSGLVGLTFDNLDVLPGSSCGDSNLLLSGDNVLLSNNSFLGQAATTSHSSEYNWVYVKGSANLIERNLFRGKNLDTNGAAITVYNKGDGTEGGHVIQYNLFKDMPGTSVQANAYAVQIGRSTSGDGNGEGNHVVRYNRFDNVIADRRVIRVQASRSSIYNNTIVNSSGGISLEDGFQNTVSKNVIISSGDNSDDSGIMFAPFGHTITGNYIAGLKTTSSQRAALLLNTETFANSGNSKLPVSPVTVAHNTVINSNHAIKTYSGSKCQANVFIANFASNLVANGVANQGGNGTGAAAFKNDCAISAASSFAGDQYYAAATDIGVLAGAEGEAILTTAANGLLAASGVGANADELLVLSDSDVGPGSSFKPAPGSYDGDINIDFSHWYITFPSGNSESNPQWLVDGGTRPDEFFYAADGGAVFKTPNIAGTTSSNTKYSRTELREMLRGPEQNPKPVGWPSTQGLNKNNWVFSNSYQRLQYEAGGVDGVMEATLKVDHVSTTATAGNEYMVGRVIVGQIHASDDEPFRLYYRKDPGNTLGSVYFATEVPGIGDNRYEMIGSSRENQPNPIDGIALGEVWSYRVEAKGDNLTVTIMRAGKPDVTRTVKTAAAYANDWMYFKAGVYNQNNGGDADDYAQATFYSIVVSHDAPPAEPGDGSDEQGSGDNDGDIVDATSLQTALLAAASGDTIKLGDGDYSNMGNIVVNTDGITLTRATGSSAVISGEFCLLISGDDVRVTGLEFADIALIADSTSGCRSNGDGSIVITGDKVIFANNMLNGDALNPVPSGKDTHNWLVVKGSNTLVERNTFQNRRGLLSASSDQVKGGFISVFVNSSVSNNTIRYNLFKDLLLENQTTAYAIQLGRTTGNDSRQNGFNTVQYNRFDNIDSPSRVIRVQGSSNTISHNTIVNSQGMISLEDGQFNEVSYNVILPSGEDSNDGGIAVAPYGHIVFGNYIAGSKTTSSERGGIYLNHNANGSGNLGLTANAVAISGNTIINTMQPIHIGGKGCGTGPAFIAEFSDNLVANGISGVAALEGTVVTGRPVLRYDCAISPASSFVGEAYFTDGLTTSTSVASPSLLNSQTGSDGAASVIAASNGLIEADGALAGSGADAGSLLVIEESEVGVGSTTSF